MRTTKDIKEEWNSKSERDRINIFPAVVVDVVVELLLDIRDKLNNKEKEE
jgi:hypothetical protein